MANRKCSAAIVSPRPGLIGGHVFCGPSQRTDDADIAVVCVVQLELEPQPETVAHRQRHFDPVRRGDDDVDAIGEARG